jgi:hypothetical protein
VARTTDPGALHRAEHVGASDPKGPRERAERDPEGTHRPEREPPYGTRKKNEGGLQPNPARRTF